MIPLLIFHQEEPGFLLPEKIPVHPKNQIRDPVGYYTTGTKWITSDMNNYSWGGDLATGVKIILVPVTGVLLIPLMTGIYFHIPPAEISGLIVSIFILQPFAIVVGLGLGIGPLPLLLIMCSFGLSVIIGLTGICDLFAERSEWLRSHLKKIEAVSGKSALLKKYGIYALIPFIWVPGIGLYGCVLIAWLFRWRGLPAAGIIFSGWILATALVLMTSLGIIELFP